MTFFSAIPTPETFIGLTKETTRGTANTSGTPLWIPATAPKFKPNIQMLNDEGLRGSMVKDYDTVPGLRYDSHGWDQLLYLDTFPLLIQAALGSKDKTTAASSATTLSEEAAVGATEVKVGSATGIVAEKSYITIGAANVPGSGGVGGSKGTAETRLVTGVSGTKLTLAYPLAFTHANGSTVTGLTAHRFSLLNNGTSGILDGNQPASYTLFDNGGENSQRMLAGCQLDTLTVTGSAEALPKATSTWFGNAQVAPGSAKTSSFTTTEAAPGWTATASIGGTQVGYLVSWEFAIKRNVKNVPAITGTQAYYQHFAGPLEILAKIVVLEDPSQTQIGTFENGTETSFDLTLQDVVTGYAVNFHSSKAKFITADLDRSKEYLEAPMEVLLLPTTTDGTAGGGGGYSPMVATVANATTTEY